MHKILIIEDDMTIARTLSEHLSKWSFEVQYVEEFKDILHHFTAFSPDLVLLDIGLPFFNGFHWCTEIRKVSKVPIVFISSSSDNMNIVMAMNMGGDDFIEKPFDLNVLTAKVQAIIRRTYTFKGQLNVLEHKGLILNLNDTTAVYMDKKVELTKNEFRILQVLLEQAGQVVDRDELIQRLWDSNSFIDDNTLTVNVTRLRKKLEELELTDFITTKKGIGYIIAD